MDRCGKILILSGSLEIGTKGPTEQRQVGVWVSGSAGTKFWGSPGQGKGCQTVFHAGLFPFWH